MVSNMKDITEGGVYNSWGLGRRSLGKCCKCYQEDGELGKTPRQNAKEVWGWKTRKQVEIWDDVQKSAGKCIIENVKV